MNGIHFDYYKKITNTIILKSFSTFQGLYITYITFFGYTIQNKHNQKNCLINKKRAQKSRLLTKNHTVKANVSMLIREVKEIKSVILYQRDFRTGAKL